ncbi:MutS-related protein [Pseudobacter ginsenosidimutans]|uniref:MutS-like protein n=1 Tax=Pseudobacter ginsenosidimutans TaxID=661488 RepID=A0A4V2F1M4_9BACT|nr:DNA mismatch repair protein [Pseudobacter ginsenosidimutans]QEC42934.1 DNA mismatch repair protein [Pseudobacter ginsenosidimutans]RZS74286.1 MutS-like protein [Pseudobacter ginsenosidimutans]
MNFKIDKQTIEELNLTGKFRSGSVYAIFNKVKTNGGERLLDHMFSHPLEEVDAINQRSSIFRYFGEAAFSFPFDVQQLNQMREHIDSMSSKNQMLVFARTCIHKILAGLTRDERYRKLVQGLQATILVLHKCHQFIQAMRSDSPFTARVDTIREILSDKRIEKLRQVDIYKSLSIQTLSSYEHLLKGELHGQMEDVLNFIYEVDLFIAVSKVAKDRKFNYAEALPPAKNLMSAIDLRHPAIDNAIGNDLRMDGSSNVLFLTGANMAGKSTLMKSIGIACYLAHMGFPVAAKEYRFSVREGLYSSINVADNIGLGYSHFYAEVVRVKQAAEAAASGKRLLLMFDELFKGTNVKDAYDGTLAITESFADYTDCLFVVSTHIIEVGEALRRKDNIRFVFMPTIMEGSVPRYTYQLREGITEDRQGMLIIRNEGILEMMDA